MQLSDDDRITYQPQRRSPTTVVIALLIAVAGIGGSAYYYLKNPDNSQQLAALKQAVNDKPVPPVVTPPEPVIEPTPAEPDPVAASEPPLEPVVEAEPLPPLDASDAGIKQELSGLAGWQTSTLGLLVNDQLLRRFVTFITNTAAGKVDHKSGPFLPLKGRFAVSSNMPLTMTPESQMRYNLFVSALTSLDPKQCAALYRRYYPLLNNAYKELGEKNNFHALVLKAIQQLDATPELTQAPALVPAEKGLYKYAQPQLEALPAVQKQMLRSGWENVSKLKIWLRQLRAALLAPPV
ncbi:MAG TPA: DUF3014 domain-containing protein [Pseudomonadales bacterium]|nr:DUF3014 domain-containing protein [Pseudomonadales bacterium]